MAFGDKACIARNHYPGFPHRAPRYKRRVGQLSRVILLPVTVNTQRNSLDPHLLRLGTKAPDQPDGAQMALELPDAKQQSHLHIGFFCITVRRSALEPGVSVAHASPVLVRSAWVVSSESALESCF